MLEPLKQWYCDECGEVIESIDDGYVLFSRDQQSGTYLNFRIIHQGRCDNDRLASSIALEDFMGYDGLSYLMTFLSLGPIKATLGERNGNRINDLDEFVDFVRRLQIPHYEEARRSFSKPEIIEHFSDSNELRPYMIEVLERISNQ